MALMDTLLGRKEPKPLHLMELESGEELVDKTNIRMKKALSWGAVGAAVGAAGTVGLGAVMLPAAMTSVSTLVAAPLAGGWITTAIAAIGTAVGGTVGYNFIPAGTAAVLGTAAKIAIFAPLTVGAVAGMTWGATEAADSAIAKETSKANVAIAKAHAKHRAHSAKRKQEHHELERVMHANEEQMAAMGLGGDLGNLVPPTGQGLRSPLSGGRHQNG